MDIHREEKEKAKLSVIAEDPPASLKVHTLPATFTGSLINAVCLSTVQSAQDTPQGCG